MFPLSSLLHGIWGFCRAWGKGVYLLICGIICSLWDFPSLWNNGVPNALSCISLPQSPPNSWLVSPWSILSTKSSTVVPSGKFCCGGHWDTSDSSHWICLLFTFCFEIISDLLKSWKNCTKFPHPSLRSPKWQYFTIFSIHHFLSEAGV